MILFLGSTAGTIPSSRPADRQSATRSRRPGCRLRHRAKPARSVLDGGEPGATMVGTGRSPRTNLAGLQPRIGLTNGGRSSSFETRPLILSRRPLLRDASLRSAPQDEGGGRRTAAPQDEGGAQALWSYAGSWRGAPSALILRSPLKAGVSKDEGGR